MTSIKWFGRAIRGAVAVCGLVVVHAALADPVGYAVDAAGDLYRIDVGAASETLIGPTGVADLVEGIASDPSGNLYATTTASDLYRLDATTGAATLIGNAGAGNFEGLDFADGTLLAIDFNRPGGAPQKIRALSPASAAATVVATLDRGDILSISSLAVTDGRTAYFQGTLALGVGTLFAVDIDSGQTTQIGDLSTPVTGLGFDGSTLFGLGFTGNVFAIDTATAAMELIGMTDGAQLWLALDLPTKKISVLECGGTGSGGDTFTFRQVRFTTDQSFSGMTLRMEATAPGDYLFDVQLLRSDSISAVPERIVHGAAIALPGNFSSTPYQPVTIDFGFIPVAGSETFVARIVNVTGPGGTLVFETFGFGNEPCPGVEVIESITPVPSVVGDPAGFRLLTAVTEPAALLVCEMPGLRNGDLADSRGVRFRTVRDFRAAELRFNASAAGTYIFDVELRRSSGFVGPVERTITGLSVDVPGGLNVQSFVPVSIDFGSLVRVLDQESFTLKITNVSGPGALLFETYGIGQTPCANVEETNENNVALPTERGDPAGYRLLSDRDLPIPTLWCASDGQVAFNVLFRGIRFTTTEPFTQVEVRMDAAVPGDYTFAAQLRRSSGFIAAPERIASSAATNVPGNVTAHPYTTVVPLDFGTEPVAPGTFTIRFVDLAGPSNSLFLDIDSAPCAGGDVVGTLENNVANPTPSGSPAGFRLLLQPDGDGDGVNDFVDNCVLAPNVDQLDTDEDGIGNRCDGDFNNDCISNSVDLGIMRLDFFQPGVSVTDMNGDGVTNPIDLGLLKAVFFMQPGPAALPNLCP